MAYLTIGGTGYDVSELEIGTFELQEAFRNAQGDALVDVINTKIKLSLTWSGITKELRNQVIAATAGGNVSVVYTDNEVTYTLQCYRGDVTSRVLRVRDGYPTHYGLNFNLIEL